jgi:hypothetical protein
MGDREEVSQRNAKWEYMPTEDLEYQAGTTIKVNDGNGLPNPYNSIATFFAHQSLMSVTVL